MKKGGDNFVLCHDLSPRLKERIETNLSYLEARGIQAGISIFH
jgi:hypothetical protein